MQCNIVDNVSTIRFRLTSARMSFRKFAMMIAVVVALFAYVNLPGYPETVNNRTGKEIQGVFMNVMKYVVRGIC